MNDVMVFLILAVAIVILLSTLDDVFVDLLSMRQSYRKKDISGEGDTGTASIGVFVASWQEENVLEQMVSGNIRAIGYPSYKLYLGVYPNDTTTREIALGLEKKYPDRVEVITNTLDGPTSKGQLLNEMFNQVYAEGKSAPDISILHDSEDIIDPASFSVFSSLKEEADFIQIPVFSLDVSDSSLVAGTYMDEFAERHTREMLTRSAIGTTVPSAGVGTGLSRKLIRAFIRQRGHVLLPGSVTEDYILGSEVRKMGLKSIFAACYVGAGQERRLVATREFFPASFWDSVRQKTRWTYGICFEGTRNLGWAGGLWERYFFFRDRKGVLVNLLPPFAFGLLLATLAGIVEIEDLPGWLVVPFNTVMLFNGAMILWRLYIRMNAFRTIYGRWEFIPVIARWLVAVAVNFFATVRSWNIFLFQSGFATRPIVWAKTEHRLPENFADSSPVVTTGS